MRAYGKRKASSHKIHPHDQCGICAGKIRRNGSERMRLKQELDNELKRFNSGEDFPDGE